MTEEEFKNSVFLFEEYDKNMLEAFFDYWSEPNKKGKMKWELEKTWELKRRLKRWFDNQCKWSGSSLNIQKTIVNANRGSNSKDAGTYELLDKITARKAG